MTIPSRDRSTVLGRLPPQQAVKQLQRIGAQEEAAPLEAALSTVASRGDSDSPSSSESPAPATWPYHNRAWQYTAHAFGYMAPDQPGEDLLPIYLASNMLPDESLRGCRVIITLDCLRVADYPGGHEHRLLFSFSGKNQLPGGTSELLNLNVTFNVQENGHVAVLGQPIFTGLFVGATGTFFTCDVVKIGNPTDIEFLSTLESNVVRGGLELMDVHQPAIPLLSDFSENLTRSMIHRNALIQHFDLGLDFRRAPMGARLAEGLYVAVQIPEGAEKRWNWDQWAYDRSSGRLIDVSRDDATPRLIPYNYICFSLDRYQDST